MDEWMGGQTERLKTSRRTGVQLRWPRKKVMGVGGEALRAEKGVLQARGPPPLRAPAPRPGWLL